MHFCVYTHRLFTNASTSDKNQSKKKPRPEKKGEQMPRSLFSVKYVRIQRTLANTMQAGNVDLNFLRLKRTPSREDPDSPLLK